MARVPTLLSIHCFCLLALPISIMAASGCKVRGDYSSIDEALNPETDSTKSAGSLDFSRPFDMAELSKLPMQRSETGYKSFIKLLADNGFSYVLVYGSRSTQPASWLAPRVIMFKGSENRQTVALERREFFKT